jgi:hypothetical protein
VPLEPAKYAALAAEGRLPEAAQVAIKNLIRVSLAWIEGWLNEHVLEMFVTTDKAV